MENGRSKRADSFFDGKGFYIVLALCIAVIGISAFSLIKMSREAAPEPDLSLEAAPTPAPVESAAPVMNDSKPTVVDVEKPKDAKVSTYKSDESFEEKPEWTWPVKGEVERGFTVETLAYDVTMQDWRTHGAVDVLAPKGELVRAAAGGEVESVTDDELYGTTVVIKHSGGIRTQYSNLAQTPPVKVGDKLKAGDIIGSVGATALAETGQQSHLHFAMTKDKVPVNPLDFMPV